MATLVPEQLHEDERVTGPVPELQAPPELSDAGLIGPEADPEAPASKATAVESPSHTQSQEAQQGATADVDAPEAASNEASESEAGGPPPEPEPHPERAAALKPFFAKLHELLDAHRELDNPSQLNIGQNSLHITVWERKLTLQVLDGQAGGQPGWVRRVAEGVAFQAKCMVDLDRLIRADEADEAAHERILHDIYVGAAIGRALHTEIQKTVDAMVVSGDIAGAKQLTLLHNKLKVAMNWLRDVLDPEVMARAKAFAEEMTIIPSDAVLPDPKKRRRRRRRSIYEGSEVTIHAGRIAQDRTRIKVMAVTFVALSAAWIYFILLPMLTRPTIPTLTIRDFRTVTEIVEITAKPPSLYVTVATDDWNQLGTAGKEWVVNATGRIAAGAGYSGAVFKTHEGEAVAQWLKKTGAKIYPTNPDPPPATQPAP